MLCPKIKNAINGRSQSIKYKVKWWPIEPRVRVCRAQANGQDGSGAHTELEAIGTDADDARVEELVVGVVKGLCLQREQGEQRVL